ncbi:MAG TPA: hypothetical protein VGM06_14455 [Polyangiaceae bacterium]|jgi:hypothetical protein
MSQPNANVSAPTNSSNPKRQSGDEQALGTSYLDHAATEQLRNRWREIQIDFVDDPRNAVTKGRALVGELVDDIVHRFEIERAQLEERWSSGENVSTEDLRRGLQRYRDFFGRLLAKLDDEPNAPK